MCQFEEERKISFTLSTLTQEYEELLHLFSDQFKTPSAQHKSQPQIDYHKLITPTNYKEEKRENKSKKVRHHLSSKSVTVRTEILNKNKVTKEENKKREMKYLTEKRKKVGKDLNISESKSESFGRSRTITLTPSSSKEELTTPKKRGSILSVTFTTPQKN